MNPIIKSLVLQVLPVVMGIASYLIWGVDTAVVVAITFAVLLLPFLFKSVIQLQKMPTRSVTSPDRHSLPLPLELEESISIIAEQRKLEAIRQVRELTDVSLKEAKEYVEALSS